MIRAQAQDSLAAQLWRVAAMADKAGEYDAADYIRKLLAIRKELHGDLMDALYGAGDG